MFTLLCITPIVYTFSQKILLWQDKRKDLVEINDIVLDYLPTIDTSVPISIITVVNNTILALNCNDYRLVAYLWIFTFNCITKGLCLLFCPLNVHRDA